MILMTSDNFETAFIHISDISFVNKKSLIFAK